MASVGRVSQGMSTPPFVRRVGLDIGSMCGLLLMV